MNLRKLEPEDLPFLYQWENDATAWGDSSTHNPLSHQDLRAYIASTTGDIYRDEQLRLIAVHEGVTVGCVDLYDFDARNRKAAVGIYIAPAFRGKGYGRLALEELKRYAFDFLHLRLLYAMVCRDNETSSALFRAAHFTPSATLPCWTLESDALVWTLTGE